jgi:predicted flap endonuclease-1-like 5' DNA nuclease
MNDMASPTPAALMNGDQGWLTLPFVVIGLGILFALYIIVWGTRLAIRRRHAQEELRDRGEAHFPDEPIPAPRHAPPLPVAPAPPPIAEAPLPAMPPPPPEPEIAPEPPIADEPITAAAPLDASPASLAADVAAPPPPSAASGDDLTRMKGVGPKLVDRLEELGITSFAQLAAMTPDEAAALDAQLGNFQGRIHRDRWIEQARFLAADDIAGYEATFGKL